MDRVGRNHKLHKTNSWDSFYPKSNVNFGNTHPSNILAPTPSKKQTNKRKRNTFKRRLLLVFLAILKNHILYKIRQNNYLVCNY